jgi:TPR repeat protein
MHKPLIGVVTIMAALAASSAALGQATPASGQAPAAAAGNVAPVTVTGRKPTDPWRPKESPVPVELRIRGTEVCNILLQDPATRQLFEDNVPSKIYEATRYPRNPDWSAPPVTPPGSPFPTALSMRDYLRGNGPQAIAGTAADGGAMDVSEGFVDPARPGGSVEKAYVACIGQGRAGANFSLPGINLTPSGGPPPRAFTGGPPGFDVQEGVARGWIKWRDTTLPLALALFEHGRYPEALDQFKVAYRKLADGDGGDEAALQIGKIYLFGLGDRSDPKEAVMWLKRAANGRYDSRRMTPRFDPREPELTTAMGEAAMILADLYNTGRGPVARDPQEARKYLDRALYVGHIPAAMALGEIYYNGIDTPRNVKKAADAYRKAASFAYAPAAVALAQMYAAGEIDGKADPAVALAWYAVAAQQDHPEGLRAVAIAYDRGEGVAADPARALSFYKLAASQGDPASQAAIGTYFYTGEGGLPKDMALARKWFELAATGGDPDGAFNLAAMPARGQGGDLDRVKAWGWLKIAEKLGHANAGAAVLALEGQFTPQDRAGVDELKRAG